MKKNDREKELKGGTGGQADVSDFVILLLLDVTGHFVIVIVIDVRQGI